MASSLRTDKVQLFYEGLDIQVKIKTNFVACLEKLNFMLRKLTETTVDVALSRSRYLFFCYHIGQNDHFSRGTPSAPLDLKAAIVSSRFVTLSWSPPKTSKEPLNGYSIYYKQVKNFVPPFI